jgi:hypothetical protein
MKKKEIDQEVEWLRHVDLVDFMQSDDVQSPWFPAFRDKESPKERTRWFSALVPVSQIPHLVSDNHGWDVGPADGGPSVWTHYNGGRVAERRYCPYGNEEGIEPLIIYRFFHGMHPDCLELAQEFRLYHNLFDDVRHKQFLKYDSNGDEIIAVRYGDNSIEILTDLLRQFCDAKQMALAVYLESFRYSKRTLAQLGLERYQKEWRGERHNLTLTIAPEDKVLSREGIESIAVMIGAKKYILPGPMPEDGEREPEVFQGFIIGESSKGRLLKHSCDPDSLANYFGKNPDAPHYLTPVFFRSEVLNKYYQDPGKYSVEDGYIRCGSLWGLRLDNDNPDYVMVFLGDLGRDLSEKERNYWLNFNIPPQGRRMSKTTFRRSFMAEFADPSRPDHAFKHIYKGFRDKFKAKHGWDFFLPLHSDDQHFFTALHLPANDNQADFDAQLLALTKVLIDCLNEKEIAKRTQTIDQGDKGISKLAKFLTGQGFQRFDEHVRFLRVLQDLRSRSAAHRKGSQYDELVVKLRLKDDGQKIVFGKLLNSGSRFIEYLLKSLCAESASDRKEQSEPEPSDKGRKTKRRTSR